MIKYFRFSWDQVLWGNSYINHVMLLATIPKYKSKGKGDGESKGKVAETDDLMSLSDFIKTE